MPLKIIFHLSKIGTYTDSAETVLDRLGTSYYGDFGSATANGYVAMTVRYKHKKTHGNPQ